MNVSRRGVQLAKQVLQEASPEIVAKIDAGELAVSQYARCFTRRKKMKEISEGNKSLDGNEKKYSVIYADPPWKYDFSFSDSRAIEEHYPTMELEEIMALPVCDLSAEHSIIFLWCPSAFTMKAGKVMEAWGFEYRTQMVWVKPSIGPGQWVRQQHELLLIGVKGKIPTPEGSDRPASVIVAPREEHSKKPDIVYDLIEKMYPELDRIELFARQQHPGWDVWGNQV
jgi:N6-adenosine-specific RNA methylase IME4